MIKRASQSGRPKRNIGPQRVLAKLVKRFDGAFAKGNAMAWVCRNSSHAAYNPWCRTSAAQALEVVMGSAHNDAGDNSESSNNCLNALACQARPGTISAVRSSRTGRSAGGGAPALCRQYLLQQLPLVLASFSAVDETASMPRC
jgi:hypothetical protein